MTMKLLNNYLSLTKYLYQAISGNEIINPPKQKLARIVNPSVCKDSNVAKAVNNNVGIANKSFNSVIFLSPHYKSSSWITMKSWSCSVRSCERVALSAAGVPCPGAPASNSIEVTA